MKRIDNPEEIIFSPYWMENILVIKDDTIQSIVYRIDEDQTEIASLKDVSDQLGGECGCIMVIVELPTSGSVYRYNNYYDGLWYKVGELDGYA